MVEAILALIVVVVLVVVGRSWLKNRTAERLGGGAAVEDDKERPREAGQRAPVSEFHVVGSEARVTFDVPLDDEDDEVLNEILLDEAMEVLRDKKHSLPISDVHEVVVFAGRGAIREVARTKLPSPGVLPPPPPVSLLHLGNVAPDPFKAGADSPRAATYETKSQVPADELPPIGQELKIPKGLQRGLRAAGVDINRANGSEIILGLLKLFGYHIEASPEPGVFNAIKDGETTLVVVEGYNPGDHPEVDEGRVRAFAGRFTMSGAQRAVFVSEKYAPFMIYDIERNEPRLRFITRERLQEFIDSMAIS
ncbi:MAG: hypothetical protein WDZ96_00350 [Acidimicrobiia bacterium]